MSQSNMSSHSVSFRLIHQTAVGLPIGKMALLVWTLLLLAGVLARVISENNQYGVGCGLAADAYRSELNRRRRVIGGNDALPHSWPWMVALEIDHGDGDVRPCGGNLMRIRDDLEESDIVLTAAHCVCVDRTLSTKPQKLPANRITVTAGKHNKNINEPGQQIRKAIEIRIPDNFLFTQYAAYNDLALIKVYPPIKFTDTIRPICLPLHREALPLDKTCMVAGWGRTSAWSNAESPTLKQVAVPIYDSNRCKVAWSPTRSITNSPILEEQMICAGSPGYSGICAGDSGGMLACQQSTGTWTLYGLTSFVPSERCWEPGRPPVFTRLSTYGNGIKQIVWALTSLK